MAISVTHATQATGADDPSKEINKAEWNAAHSLAGLGTGVETALGVNVGDAGAVVVNGGALGTPSSGTLTNATGLPVGGISATGTPDNTTFLRGDGSWAAAGGGAALSGITAAAAGNTIASGNNHSQIWNWALTSNNVNAFTFGETTAATGGTSTSGVPNQYIVRHTTLAASTASPWGVYVRGNHVVSASPSARQLLGFEGAVANPTYAFAANVNSGLYNNGGDPAMASAGSRIMQWASNRCYTVDGGTTFPAIGNLADGSSGWSWPSNVLTGVVGSVRHVQFTAGAGTWYKGSADAVGYAVNYRKSRGTAESPTAITTGDDLATISGYGYVGATGTYVEAARFVFDSTGTIANTTSGVGGISRMMLSAVGAVGPSEVMRWQRATTTGGGWATMDEADANPGTGDVVADEEFAIYRKADKLVIAHNLSGTMNYLTIPLDGSTTTWTQGTGAP